MGQGHDLLGRVNGEVSAHLEGIVLNTFQGLGKSAASGLLLPIELQGLVIEDLGKKGEKIELWFSKA